jgi:PelA/Pel-15E family pectate lyase
MQKKKIRCVKVLAFRAIIVALAAILVCLVAPVSAQRNKDLTVEEVLKAMRKSTDYLANKVSLHGGYLWEYAEDGSEQFGEAPARKSQIWVQGSGTPRMGETYLELYKVTGDKAYLEYAKKAADALIYGQHPLGGWHYFIDFDKAGLNEWYEKVSSRFLRGMEEFRHYYGNCTFDDNVTQGATTFLLHLYLETHDPIYFGALNKALNFILIAQYPNGGWPQRYPLRYEFVHDGLPDYTSNYTLNDDAMNNTINLLLEAYEALGNEAYLEAARRGGDFFIIAQGPTESPAWSEQYDRNVQPAWARTHEPPAYGTRQTAHTVEMLMKLYLFTGDRRYLRPVPATLSWMETSKIKALENGQYEMARYYDPHTNLPVDFEILEKRTPEGYMTFRYFASSEKPFPGRKANVDFVNLKKEYTLLSALKPGEEKAAFNQRYRRTRSYGNPDKSKVLQLIGTLNNDGVWMEDLSVMDVTKTMLTDGPESRKLMRGFSTRSYMENMNTLIGYVLHAKQPKIN